MASIEPEDRNAAVESVLREIQPELSPPQYTDTDSVSVRVENPDSGSKQPEISPPPNTDTNSVSVKVENPDSGSEQPAEAKSGSFLTCCFPRYYLFYCLPFICLAPVAYALITVATVISLPLLVAAFLVVRLFQFIVSGEDAEKHFRLKVLLYYWIFMAMMLLLVEIGLFYPIAKYVPGIKLIMIIGLSITEWLEIFLNLIGIYLVNPVICGVLGNILGQVISDDGDKQVILLDSVSEIFGCLLLLWADVAVIGKIPISKPGKIFGIYTDKWIKVSLFVLIGYNIITLLTHIFVWSLPKIYRDRPRPRLNIHVNKALKMFCCDKLKITAVNRRYVVYAATGLKRSIIFLLSMVMLLITWVVYFGNRLDTTPEDKKILEFGTWTMVSILVCSFLWLIKSCILLYWEAHAVYERIYKKIASTGTQLYFLIMLSDTHYKKVVVEDNGVQDSSDSDCGSSCCKTPPKKKERWVLCTSDTDPEGTIDKDKFLRVLDRRSVRADLINDAGPKEFISVIQKAAQRVLTTQHALSMESLVADLSHFQDNDPEQANARCIEILKEIVQVNGDPYYDKDWEILLHLLPDVDTEEDITFQTVKTFMERAHSRCICLVNMLISENEVVKCLNQVISGIIIGVTFLIWILLTGLATTKVLVLIASPVLAATFVFGDTAKSLFQGLIFVYVVHPFDVGDLCVLDEQLLKVTRIGIWSTTFSKVRTVGKQQQVIYPNSVLAVKNVINHKTEFDWHDYLEFISYAEITGILKKRIESYLKQNSGKFTPQFDSVEVVEIGDRAKTCVHIKHKIETTEDWTYLECLKKKEERRFEFAIYVQTLVKHLESRTGTPEAEEMEEFFTRG